MEVIGTTDLNMVYGDEEIQVEALKDITLEISEGELVSLVGPSGSGKSSLLHIIGAMLTPTSGEVRVMGEPIQSYNRRKLSQVRREKIGFIFQNFALVSQLTALENVMLPMYPINPPDLKQRAIMLLERVGLGHRLQHTPAHLSGGEKQRVAIARALINNPSIVLGDEITGNLDTSTGMQIFDVVKELNESENITFLIVTHDLEVAQSCKRTIEMRDGMLIGQIDY